MEEEHPFKENLSPSKISRAINSKLFEFEKNKTKIIREFPLNSFPEIFENKLNREESILKTKGLFDEIRNKYKIEAPVDYVIGKNKNGIDVIFIITDKINTEEKKEFSLEEKNKIFSRYKKLFNSLILYIKDKYPKDEWMMWDIAGKQQYVYGKKPGQDEEKVYLIDTDLKYAGLASIFVFTYLRELTLFISSIEEKLKMEFKEERSDIINFLDKIKPEDKKWKDFDIRIINKILNI